MTVITQTQVNFADTINIINFPIKCQYNISTSFIWTQWINTRVTLPLYIQILPWLCLWLKFPVSKESRCYCFLPFGCHERNETWDPQPDSNTLWLHCIYEARRVVEWKYRVIYGCHYPEACRLNLSHRSPCWISSVQHSELKLVLPKLTLVGAGVRPARCSHVPVLFTYVWECGRFLSFVMSKTIIFHLTPSCAHVGGEPVAGLCLANRWHCNSLFCLLGSCPWCWK